MELIIQTSIQRHYFYAKVWKITLFSWERQTTKFFNFYYFFVQIKQKNRVLASFSSFLNFQCHRFSKLLMVKNVLLFVNTHQIIPNFSTQESCSSSSQSRIYCTIARRPRDCHQSTNNLKISSVLLIEITCNVAMGSSNKVQVKFSLENSPLTQFSKNINSLLNTFVTILVLTQTQYFTSA